MISLLAAFGVVVLVSVAWFFFFRNGDVLGDRTTVRIRDAVFSVDVANTAASRAQGLSGRAPLAEKEGMFFIFDTASTYDFWMKDMQFAIDIIWINGATVVDVTRDARPEPGVPFWSLQRYHPSKPADRVLEVLSGTADRYGIQAGDEVVVE